MPLVLLAPEGMTEETARVLGGFFDWIERVRLILDK